MKIEQLRRGNEILVSLPGEKIRIPNFRTKVQGITIFGEVLALHTPHAKGYEIPPQHCMGVKLTEAEILNFGFNKGEWVHPDKSVTPVVYKMDDIILQFYSATEAFGNDAEFIMISTTRPGHPKDLMLLCNVPAEVHRLQNICLDIFNIEL